jgi:hypothetical protein
VLSPHGLWFGYSGRTRQVSEQTDSVELLDLVHQDVRKAQSLIESLSGKADESKLRELGDRVDRILAVSEI